MKFHSRAFHIDKVSPSDDHYRYLWYTADRLGGSLLYRNEWCLNGGRVLPVLVACIFFDRVFNLKVLSDELREFNVFILNPMVFGPLEWIGDQHFLSNGRVHPLTSIKRVLNYD
jgi:hypothetical protein